MGVRDLFNFHTFDASHNCPLLKSYMKLNIEKLDEGLVVILIYKIKNMKS